MVPKECESNIAVKNLFVIFVIFEEDEYEPNSVLAYYYGRQSNEIEKKRISNVDFDVNPTN